MACLSPAGAQELSGTPYSVLWRGSAFAHGGAVYGRQAPSAQGVTLRLVDVTARREVSRAVFDARLGGWMFQMPLSGLDGRPARCLALVDPRNQFLAVRQPLAGDTGATFRHPLWEREWSRGTELAALKKEFASVEAQAQAAAGDIARLSAETGLPPGASAEQCPVLPVPADPPRPAAALEPGQAAPLAGAVCALRWERDHGSRVNLARMFADAGAAHDWRARGDAAVVADGMPGLRIPIAGSDLALVTDAAAKGRTFMEHADGVRLFSRAHGACKDEVTRQAADVRQRWADAVQESRQQPERARAQCAQKLAQMVKLQAARAAAPQFLAALDKQIAQLSAPPPASDAMPLQAQLCQP